MSNFIFLTHLAALHAAGGVFDKSGNGVWLIDSVPPHHVRALPD